MYENSKEHTYLTSLTHELRAECWKQLVRELNELQREMTKGVWSTLLSSLAESGINKAGYYYFFFTKHNYLS